MDERDRRFPLGLTPADLQRMLPDMRQVLGALSSVSVRSIVEDWKEIQPYAESLRDVNAEIVRSIDLSAVTATMSSVLSLAEANGHMLDLACSATREFTAMGGKCEIDPSWLASRVGLGIGPSILEGMAKSVVADATCWSTAAALAVAGLDLDTWRKELRLPDRAMVGAQTAVRQLTQSYAGLADSLQSWPDITRLPDYSLPGGAREVFATGYALDAVRPSRIPGPVRRADMESLAADLEAEVSVCASLLEAVDPALVAPYIGAHEALRGEHPDRARHVESSLRELWGHLLRRLAPDEDVLAWIPPGHEELLHDGKPTRRARVKFICRKVDHGPLTAFVDKDVDALLNLLDLFQRLHQLDGSLDDAQMRALALRSDSGLLYILRVVEV